MASQIVTQCCQATAFWTELDWMALAWTPEERIWGLAFARSSAAAALRHATAGCEWIDADQGEWPESIAELIGRLRQYAAGELAGDFEDVAVEPRAPTPFQRQVIRRCRAVPSGQTTTYGRLAAQAGSPRAARAVGNVMRNNRVPLIIPCHRVLASGGKLHGFSSPKGLAMKRRLLDMERGIRNSNFEIRNEFKTQSTKEQNQELF